MILYCVEISMVDLVSTTFIHIKIDYGDISSIILGEHTQKLQNKNTKTVHSITQGVSFNTNYTSTV